MINNIKLAIFDLAGTTIKDNGDIVNKHIKDALNSYGIKCSKEQINEVMGLKKPFAIGKLIEKCSFVNHNNVVKILHNLFVTSMIEYYKNHKDVSEVDGTSDTFLYLKSKNIKVAINTGFSRDITDVILDRMGWIKNNMIETSISSDEVENGRPHHDMIFEIMRRVGLTDANLVAKIGDSKADLLEGSNAKCGLVVGVTEGSHTREQLLDTPHSLLIPNVTYLKDIL